jgi:polysaccharide chain length determinant protein (PEP-CTERM system associated)
MDELLRQAGAILRAMWRHRWLGLAVAWLAGAIGAVAVMRVPDKYEASARIFVDTQSILQPLMAGLAIQPNIEQQVMMLSRTLISRPNVERLVRMADLDLNIKSKSDQEDLVDGLMKTLEIKSAGRDNLYTLRYRAADPEKAKRVVQSLVSIFVESSLGDKQKDSTSARQFIEEQVKSYEKKLEEAENRLKEFKLRNIDLQMGEGKGLVGRIADISEALAKAQLELREAENSRDAIKRQLVGEEPVLLPDMPGGSESSVSMPEVDGRIEAQKRNLDSLLQRFTEQHPDVVGARRMIKELEEQKRQEVAARKKAAAANPAVASINTNPAYQQMKVALTEAEASVASLRVRVAEYDARYRRALGTIKGAPQIEAEFAQLNRDYDVHKKNYESLVARRESASMTGELESTGGVADFRLIDPPRASKNPVAPNRLLLLSGMLLAALLAGLGASFVASQLRPVIFDGRLLREVTGLPLLGSISMLQSEGLAAKERSRNRKFFLGFFGLIGMFGLGILVLVLIAGRTA